MIQHTNLYNPGKNYGKTCGIYHPKYKPIKKGNKVKFEMNTEVTVGGRRGKIVDHYVHGGVFFYRIKWQMPRQTTYDKHIEREAPKFGWEQSRFIRKVDAID